jgi:uroporphyrinogen decarboxylase
MHFQPVDHIPDEEFGYWEENSKVWQAQGLPEGINLRDDDVANEYFGFSPKSSVPVQLGLEPGFESEILEETDTYQIMIDGDGVKKKVFKDGTSTIPHYLEFPLKGRKEWEELFKPRLDIQLTSRYPENRPDWKEMKARFNDPNWDRPVGIGIGSLFGWPRDWAGFEGMSMLCYDDQDLVREIVEHLATLTCAVIKRAAEEIQIDYGAGWEDMCFNHGPIISPAMVREFLTPNYKRISDVLRENGCDIIYTDCDGNINPMIDPWLEGGLSGIFPVEVHAGTDPVAIRKKYRDKVVILGGMDKRALIVGKEAIRAEIKRIKPYVLEGGWIPHVDHRCPPDVTFENYLYYLDVKRETFGIPKPETFEARPEVQKIKSAWKGSSVAV